MRHIDILMRNAEYAFVLQDLIKSLGFDVSVLDTEKPQFKKDSLILLDAHFSGQMGDFKGFDLLPKIRLRHNNQEKVMLISWFNREQMKQLNQVGENSLKLMDMFNKNGIIETFPLKTDSIVNFLNA
jgi:hypothetical protein